MRGGSSWRPGIAWNHHEPAALPSPQPNAIATAIATTAKPIKRSVGYRFVAACVMRNPTARRAAAHADSLTSASNETAEITSIMPHRFIFELLASNALCPTIVAREIPPAILARSATEFKP